MKLKFNTEKLFIAILLLFVNSKAISQTDTSIIESEYKVTPEEIISITGPVKVLQGETVTVNVAYSTATKRDIIVSFQESGVDINGDGVSFSVFGKTRKTVIAGQGTLKIDVPIRANTPISSDYRYAVVLTTVGGRFKQKVAPGKAMKGVSVVTSKL